ncbi:MAG: twin-arginine translocase TatA/TatE family subunit [Verrucomicrobiota bacterium]
MITPVAFGLPQGPEILIIFLVFLLLFGASRLPGLARALGKSLGEFRKAKQELDREIERAAEESESKESLPGTQAQGSTPSSSSSPSASKSENA